MDVRFLLPPGMIQMHIAETCSAKGTASCSPTWTTAAVVERDVLAYRRSARKYQDLFRAYRELEPPSSAR